MSLLILAFIVILVLMLVCWLIQSAPPASSGRYRPSPS